MPAGYNVCSGIKRSNTPTLYERDFPSEVVSVGSLHSLSQREENESASFKLRHKNDSYGLASADNDGVSMKSSESYLESSDNENDGQLSFKPLRMLRGDTNTTLTAANVGMTGNNNGSAARLNRVYSDTEKVNFHEVTGIRMYDDMKYRPMHFQNNSNDSDGRSSIAQDPMPINITPRPDVGGYRQSIQPQVVKRRFSSGERNTRPGYPDQTYDAGNTVFGDMQDEYIPDFDFAEAVSQWQSSDDTNNMLTRFNTWDSDYFGKNLKESSLKLDDLHSQVEPIPLPNASVERKPNIPISRPSSSSLFSPSSLRTPPVRIEVSDNDLDRIMQSIPSDFINMPFSQRKKIIEELSPGYDYKTIMNILKREKLSRSGSLHNMRSRHGSVASKYLNSFTPGSSSFRKDDKGSFILGHRLGKVIGFGAWGMIRECFVPTEDGLNTSSDGIDPQCKAMKIIKFKDNQNVKRQVLREVSIWSKLSHPNIVPLKNWKLEDDLVAYCLMDKVSNGTLYDLVISWGECRTSSISLEDRCKITLFLVLQLIDAVQYMHSKHIVHGDIKLENCLLEKKSENYTDWKLKLCDFGMSHFYGRTNELADNESVQLKSLFDGSTLRLRRRPSIPRSSSSTNNSSLRINSRLRQIVTDKKLIHDDTSLSMSDANAQMSSTLPTTLKPNNDNNKELTTHINDDFSRIGSLPYAAPELLEPNPPPFGPSFDVWAIGVLLYTMLTGKLPFKHEYEPRLRVIITSGKYDVETLKKVCNCDLNSNPDASNAEVKFQGLYNAVKGCLTKDITRRWELEMVKVALESC